MTLFQQSTGRGTAATVSSAFLKSLPLSPNHPWTLLFVLPLLRGHGTPSLRLMRWHALLFLRPVGCRPRNSACCSRFSASPYYRGLCARHTCATAAASASATCDWGLCLVFCRSLVLTSSSLVLRTGCRTPWAGMPLLRYRAFLVIGCLSCPVKGSRGYSLSHIGAGFCVGI